MFVEGGTDGAVSGRICDRDPVSERAATINFDAGRDIYLGYRNATKYYPVYGASTDTGGI